MRTSLGQWEPAKASEGLYPKLVDDLDQFKFEDAANGPVTNMRMQSDGRVLLAFRWHLFPSLAARFLGRKPRHLRRLFWKWHFLSQKVRLAERPSVVVKAAIEGASSTPFFPFTLARQQQLLPALLVLRLSILALELAINPR